MYISAAIARGVLAVAANRYFVTLEQLCTAAEVSPDLLADPTAMMPTPDFDRLVKAAMTLTGDGGIGLHLGSTAPLGMLNVVGHLVSNATTLRQAFASFRRFLPLLIEGARYDLIDSQPVATFRCDIPASDDDVRRFHAEVCLALVVRFAREVHATHDAPLQVEVVHAAPAYRAEYTRVFGCPIRFGGSANALRFSSSILDMPILLNDQRLAETLRVRAEQLLHDRGAPEQLPGRVFRLLRDAPSLDGIDEEEVARRLRTTPRTLRRRLAVYGRPFSTLLDDVRRDRALASLLRPELAVKELAIELGFSEPSALHRAFKRWTGTTVGAYRRRHDVA